MQSDALQCNFQFALLCVFGSACITQDNAGFWREHFKKYSPVGDMDKALAVVSLSARPARFARGRPDHSHFLAPANLSGSFDYLKGAR
jgi:hypothetical protein